jgi:hypothetical protein
MKKISFRIVILTLLNLAFIASSFATVLTPQTPTLNIQKKGSFLEFLMLSSFEQTWMRYPSPDMIIEHFNYHFPLSKVSDPNSPSYHLFHRCGSLNSDNRVTLGDNSPISGNPLIETPNSSFVNWYANCLKSLIIDENSRLAPMNFSESEIQSRLNSKPPIEEECLAQTFGVKMQFHLICSWSGLDSETQRQFIKNLITEIIGPEEVIRDLKISNSIDDLTHLIWQEMAQFNETAMSDRYKFLDIQPKMSVLKAYHLAKFLILITDLLRY